MDDLQQTLNTCVWTILTVLFSYYLFNIFQAFWSFRHIPGPFLNHVSRLPYIYHLVIGDPSDWARSLHKAYRSPIVTLGSRLVSVTGPENINIVLGNGIGKVPLTRDALFNDFLNFNGPHASSIISINDPHLGVQRRKIWTHLFSKQHLEGETMKDMLNSSFQAKRQELMEKFSEKGSEEATVTIDWIDQGRSLTMFIILSLIFGVSFSREHFSVEVFDAKRLEATDGLMLDLMLRHFNITKPIYMMLKWYKSFRSSICGKEVLPWIGANEALVSLVREKCLLFQALGEKDAGLREEIEAEESILNALYTSGLDQETIEAEVIALLLAGHHTAVITTCLVIMAIIARPEVLVKLRNELDDTFESIEGSSLPYDRLDKLPYLSLVIKETLRLYAPSPAPAPRLIPDEGLILCGKYIPSGAGCTAMSGVCNLDPSIFPNPDDFVPERWISPTKEMKQSEISFSTGPRRCPGDILAFIQIRALVAMLFYDFDIELSKNNSMHKRLVYMVVHSPDGKCLFDLSLRRHQE